MAHFAELGSNNIIERVVVVADSDTGGGTLATESVGISFCKSLFGADTNWKQTSITNSFRGNFAGIGGTYMEDVATLGVASTDVFMDSKPFPLWHIGISTAEWYPPDDTPAEPTLTEEDIEAGKWYEWSPSNYAADPSTSWVLTS